MGRVGPLAAKLILKMSTIMNEAQALLFSKTVFQTYPDLRIRELRKKFTIRFLRIIGSQTPIGVA